MLELSDCKNSKSSICWEEDTVPAGTVTLALVI